MGLTLEPFKAKSDVYPDINFHLHFCPAIETLALESDRVSRQSGGLFRGVSFGVNSLSAKLLKVPILCSLGNKR